MPASQGTPTIWEKISALWGGDGANNATVLAGDQADLTKAEQAVLALFKPVLTAAESDGIGDLVTFLSAVASIPSVTSVGQALNIAKGALAAEAGPLAAQANALGVTSLTTLASAALAAAGKVNAPLT